MPDKLDGGDRFPTMELESAQGGRLTLPDDLRTSHGVVLFYRGHW